MLGFNWVDAIIVILVAAAVHKGARLGFAVQLSVIACFFAGLFMGGWLFPHLLPLHNRMWATVVNGTLVLVLAGYLAGRGLVMGRAWRYSLRLHPSLRWLEVGLGTMLLAASILVVVWLLAVMIGRLPFAGFSNSTNDARIVQFLDSHLPPVPAVFAEFDLLVNPNQSPYLFVPTPQLSSAVVMDEKQDAPAAAAASAATVRITSFGCGGIIAGSGFVVAPDLIATNAHVVAGASRPIIKYHGKSYASVPVLFNANLDLALLRVQNFPGRPLKLGGSDVPVPQRVIITGYPNGTYAAVPGLIRINETLVGTNIYDEGTIGRDIYDIQTQLNPGSSGSPVVALSGQAIGIIFGRSTENPNYSFAITSPSIKPLVQQAANSTRRVSTGACLAS